MRLVLADDSVLLRRSLAVALAQDGFDVVGEAGDGEELLELVRVLRPDVAVVDIRMPPTWREEGLVAAGRLAAEHPEVGVLLLSQHVQTGYALRALTATASRVGYLLKDRVTEPAELGDALRRVAAGETVIDPDVVARLLGRRRVDSALDELTPREQEVLALMAQGRTNSAIAEALVLSQRTVESHVRNLFTKLGIEPGDDRANPRVLAVLQYLRR